MRKHCRPAASRTQSSRAEPIPTTVQSTSTRVREKRRHQSALSLASTDIPVIMPATNITVGICFSLNVLSFDVVMTSRKTLA